MTLKEDLIKLTDERNEWLTRCEFLSQQRDKLTAERYALKASNDSYIALANTAYELTEQRTAERDTLTARIAGLEAARFAYASEFALDAEDQPDVGSIHQNIRALKDAAKLALDALTLMADEITVALLLGVDSPFEQDTTLKAREAIAALKAVP